MKHHKLKANSNYDLMCGLSYKKNAKNSIPKNESYAWLWREVTCKKCLKLKKV